MSVKITSENINSSNTNIFGDWISYIEDRPFNDQRYYISNQKLKDLGWNVTISFNKGIQMLI